MLLESLRNQKSPLNTRFLQNTNFVFARNEFLSLVGARTECLSIIIIYYTFEYTFGIKTTLLESLRSQKKPFKGSILAKLVKRT